VATINNDQTIRQNNRKYIHVYGYIKSFITRDKKEEELDEETEEDAKETEEPMCNITNYSEVINQIKQLALFTLQNDDINGFNLLKTTEIYFEKNYSENKNLKKTNITQNC